MNKTELRNTILSAIELPHIGKNEMTLSANGGVQTQEIQSAIDALSAAGGGTLTLQPGVYHTGALHLKSGVELHLASAGTVVRFVTDELAKNYPLVDRKSVV